MAWQVDQPTRILASVDIMKGHGITPPKSRALDGPGAQATGLLQVTKEKRKCCVPNLQRPFPPRR